ncbi:MAG: 30S ribosomal protein S3 [Promethearchaeota archaeon]
MPAEDHFINRGLLKVKVNDFLRQELRRAGYAGVDLQKTPLGMRVVVYASRPGMVIGRRGTTVRELTETLEHEFGLEAPQIEVSEVEVPELNGPIMAERLAQRLERGDHFRRAAYGVLRRIISAGAKGVEISLSGKLTSRRARYQKFRSGFVAKTGEPIRTAVSHGWAFAIMKPGVLGVQVRIMLPDAVAPDHPVIVEREVVVEAVPTPTPTTTEPSETPEAADIEIIEEELPIEEASSIEEFVDESTEPVPEPTPAPTPESVPKEVPSEEEKPAPEEPKAKPKAKSKEEPEKAPEKPKAKPKAKKKEVEKAKPKAKKEKAETKPKAKPKAKKKAEPKEKAKKEKKAESKAAKKEEKPKAKAMTSKAAEKEKKSKSKETKAKASKSKKESSKK